MSDELVLALLQEREHLGGQRVQVLLEEAVRPVEHRARVVLHREAVGRGLVGAERAVRRQLFAKLGHQRGGGRLGKAALLVDQLEEADRALGALDQIHALLIVHVAKVGHRDAVALVFGLLLLEERRDVQLLQRLVGVVDAQLLKAVVRKVLKAVDVQHRDGAGHLVGGAHGHVHHADQPREQHPVELLAESVAHVDRLGGRQRNHEELTLDDVLSMREVVL
mmetsp:Transcript_26152/g.65746  ORF Transcript_26152/g.65746 Transcript_26152/m.65746 type:complete len:222 (+) Transcript_26152:898-1563(+)